MVLLQEVSVTVQVAYWIAGSGDATGDIYSCPFVCTFNQNTVNLSMLLKLGLISSIVHDFILHLSLSYVSLLFCKLYRDYSGL